MVSLARILMLVQRGAVEPCHAMRVGGEMPRHPIDYDANFCAVAGIDKSGKSLGRAKPGARRKQAQRLISPRAAEWMLAHRHQLYMGEAHLLDVRHQPFGQFIPAWNMAVGMDPGRGMNLVERQWSIGL